MISVIIPIFNREKLISRTLNCFKVQSFKDWECIIVDDYSTDKTKEIVMSHVDEDSRFRYTKNTHSKGAQGARNTGIEMARGEWVALFDSDDYAYPNFLEELSNKISDNIDVITSNANVVDVKSGEVLEVANWCAEGQILQKLLNGMVYVGYNCCLVKKKALCSISLLDENCPSMQEFDTHIRLSRNGCTYTATNLTLSDYYVGGKDTISIDKVKYIEGMLYVLKKHCWIWRRYAYSKFISKISEIWSCINHADINRKKYKINLLLMAPELLLLYVYRKIKYLSK